MITSRITAPMVAYDDFSDDAAADVQSYPWQQPAADEGADDADDDIADEAEANAFHDQAGEPAGNGADDEQDDQSLRVPWRVFLPDRGDAPSGSRRSVVIQAQSGGRVDGPGGNYCVVIDRA